MENSLIQLNLPPFVYDLRRKGNVLFIFDVLRKQYVQLTPEEWVRQHFLHYLVGEGYPKSLMSLEKGIAYNGLQKRTDLWVADSQGRPFLLVECKAPRIALNESVLLQTVTYNATLKAPYLAMTNGLAHHYFEEVGGRYEEVGGLPKFQ